VAFRESFDRVATGARSGSRACGPAPSTSPRGPGDDQVQASSPSMIGCTST